MALCLDNDALLDVSSRPEKDTPVAAVAFVFMALDWMLF
jgi:hypothetical protein